MFLLLAKNFTQNQEVFLLIYQKSDQHHMKSLLRNIQHQKRLYMLQWQENMKDDILSIEQHSDADGWLMNEKKCFPFYFKNNSYICQESERNLLNRNMQKCKTLISMMMLSVGNSWTLKNNFTKRQEWKLWRNTESVLSENVKKNSISCICSFWKSQWIHLKKYGEESQRFRNEKKWNDWDSSVIVILMHTEIDGHELYKKKKKNDSFQYMSETKMKKTFYFWQNINIIPLHYH